MRTSVKTTALFRLPVFTVCCTALFACTIARAQTQAASPVTAAAPLTHPISPEAALRLTPTVGSRNGYEPQESNVAPLSLAANDAEGVLYNRNVNRINDSADRVDDGAEDSPAGVTKRDETWLATAYGVKCVDRHAGIVRHYALTEGLPGTNVIAIAADSADVWCLVVDRLRPYAGPRPAQRIHLCVLDAKAQRWSERGSFEIPIPKDPMDSYKLDQGRCLLSLSQRYVAIVTSRVTSEGTAFVHLCDRKSGEFSDLPWEQGLRADVSFIESKALKVDGAGVWFGTDHGVFRWSFVTSTWNRTLPDHTIAFGAEAMNGNAFWVVDEPRQRQDSRPFSGSPATEWRLSRVSTIDDAVASWPAPGLTIAPPVPNDPEYNVGFAPGGDPAIDLSHELPIGLCIEKDGMVWTTHQGQAPAGFGPSVRGSGWARFDPATKAWTAYGVHVTRTAVFFGWPRIGYEIDIGGPDNEIPTPLAAIPDGAVRALCLSANPLGASSSNNSANLESEGYWLRHRFPEWLCPDSSKPDSLAKAGLESVPRPPRPQAERPIGPLPDPSDPAMTWMVGTTGSTLVHAAPGDLSADLLAVRLGKQYTYRAGDLPPDIVSGHGRSYSLMNASDDSRNAVKVRPSVVGLISRPSASPQHLAAAKTGITSGPNGPELLVETNTVIYAVRSDSDTLVPLRTIGRNPYNSRGQNVLAVDGSSESAPILYVQNLFAGNTVVDWDPGRSLFTLLPDTTSIAGTRDVLAVNPADGGLWLRVDGAARSGETAVYLPGSTRTGHVETNGSIRVVTAPSAAHGSWRLIGATAAIAWWAASSGSPAGNEVRGYDGARQRWIAALPAKVADPFGMDFVRTERSGEIYIACESLVGTAIWRYDGANDRWTAVADAPLRSPTDSPASPSPYASVLRPQMVSVSRDAILMVAYTTQLCRFDRKSGHWDASVPLPKSLQDASQPMERSVAEAGDAVYVGSSAGLYRLRLIAGAEKRLPTVPAWESLLAPVQTIMVSASGQSPARQTNLRLTAIAPGRKSVYALVSSDSPQALFAGRLDIASGRWTLYDETRGFPGNDLSTRLFGDGEEGGWASGLSGVYRYDKATDRWQQIFVETGAPPIYASAPPAKSTSEPEPIVEISSSQILVGNSGETDVLTQPPYRQNATPGETLPTIWRFANDDGRLIGKITTPAPGGGYAKEMLAKGDGDIWVGLGSALYLVRPGASAQTWRHFALPQALPGISIQHLAHGPNGGLWITDIDNAYFWKNPHEQTAP